MELYKQVPPPVRKFVEITLLVIMFVALTISLLGSNGLLRLNFLRSERQALEQKDAELTTQIAGIKQEIEAINNDPVEIERKVRSELGFARPDEVVYVFPKAPQ